MKKINIHKKNIQTIFYNATLKISLLGGLMKKLFILVALISSLSYSLDLEVSASVIKGTLSNDDLNFPFGIGLLFPF